jgi:DNA polymerase-3 subunit alpha
MGAVKNVGEAAVQEMIRERTENGPFDGFIDFCERVNLKTVGKRVIESLIKVGGFDKCEKLNRKTLLESMELIIAYGQKKQQERELGQVSLFDVGGKSTSSETQELLDIQEVPDFDDKEKLQYEYKLMGIYVSGHPLNRYADILKQMTSMPIKDLQDIPGSEKRDFIVGGLIAEKKVILTKKGDKMCFATLEDLSGKIECLVFPRTFAEYEELLNSDEPLVLTGQVNLSEEPRKFFPNKIQKLDDQAEERVTGVRINVKMDKLSEPKLEKFKQLLLSYRGSVPGHIIFEGQDVRARLKLNEEFLMNPTPQMAARINELFNDNSVQFIVDGRVENAVNS